MPTEDACEICGLSDQSHDFGSVGNQFRVSCERCGVFEWSSPTPSPTDQDTVTKLSAFVREQNEAGNIPTIDGEVIKTASLLVKPRIADRAMRVLQAIARTADSTVSRYDFTADPSLIAISYSNDYKELYTLLNFLIDEEYLSGEPSFAQVTAAGFIAAEDIQVKKSVSETGFIAMSFDEAMDMSFQCGFDPALRTAGYRPVRIDRKEHVNSISDEIMAEIRRSRFVIADYTLSNNGVYFEAGFAMGLGITVIPTCRKDYISKLHFDIRHINTLLWETPNDLAVLLSRRISAVVGDGPLTPTPLN